jgi:N6-adenosine-specific RNA methylase IME4
VSFSSAGSTKKPEDMYRIIEHFALGRRRLELFGEDHNIRPGWLTLGKNLSYSNFNKEVDGWIFNFMRCYLIRLPFTSSRLPVSLAGIH